MATGPKLAPRTTRIQLKYDANGVTSVPPSPVRLEKNQKVEFFSDGPVTVELSPASAYQPSKWSTGDAKPVLVKKAVKGKVWCAFGQFNPKIVKKAGWGIDIDPEGNTVVG